MPFGRESTGDCKRGKQICKRDSFVTNAFRQGVHWGLEAVEFDLNRLTARHQCLSAGSPLGTHGTPTENRDLRRRVTNAFRQGVHWGRKTVRKEPHEPFQRSPMPFGRESTGDDLYSDDGFISHDYRHQCLSAGSPLGTDAESLTGVWSLFRHQCLSAGSPLGTRVEESYHTDGEFWSPMPFGRESTGDWVE